ncbi:hypothetical protein ACF090_43250 [Streptomyces sp. NPDC014892]|uniref:hypothetical protein n=1 Tax=Streptomyces sp. NPDC014892 TaxID=3364930 RepID=UPI0036FD7EA1
MRRLQLTVPPNLSGSYQPRTDHLRFNVRIPDEFPFIDYEVRRAEDLPGLAVIVEEFLHRCQWAATPFGLVYRTAALVQARLGLRLLCTLAADPSLRLPTPWTKVSVKDVAAPLAEDLHTVNALETLIRFLFGAPLGRPLNELHAALDTAREALTHFSPLSFGTFQAWNPQDVVYRQDGTPITNRTTREVMESHASAFAVELLRSRSAAVAGPWFDEHTRRKRIGMYAALEELTNTARLSLESLPHLGTRCLLQLADLAIGEQFANIPGLPPPADYVESMLPYVRYGTALKDVARSADALALLERQSPEEHAGLDDALRLSVIMSEALTIRGQASPVFGIPVMSRRPVMLLNAAAARQWGVAEVSALQTDGDVGLVEEALVGATAHAAIRFFMVQGEMQTDAVLFEPTVERFLLLTRLCDWPVVEYDDGLEVFLCDAMDDPGPVVIGQATVFEVSKAIHALLKQSCTVFDGDAWRIGIHQRSLTEVVGVRAGQLVGTP